MGKKKGKKVDVEKRAALEARKEAKAEKAARKRLFKEGGVVDQDDDSDAEVQDLDTLLRQYKISDQAGRTTTVETLDSFPLPRANATLTLYEDSKKKEIFLFGGEYYDGVETIHLNHLVKYDVGKNEWKQINCPVSPPSRCAHSMVYYNHCLYLFGGEISQAEQFNHYKDLWKFHIKEQQWEELKPAKAVGSHPTARSGQVSVVWKNYMILFGGFFEANKETPRWYNDVYVFNLQTETWLDVPHSKLAVRPEPRSACNAAVIGDDVVIHGGFSKLTKSALQRQKAGELEIVSETKVHTDSWILHLRPILSGKPPTWERLTSSVQRTARTVNKSPNGRAAMASAGYKNRLLSFGGVFDTEAMHHKLNSVFFNDLFSMDVERRKWLPMTVRGKGEGATTAKQKKDTIVTPQKEETTAAKESDDEFEEEELLDEDENVAKESAWDLEKLRSNMFAFIDGDGNIVYEKTGDDSDEEVGRPNLSKEALEEEDDDEEKEEEKDNDSTRSDEANVAKAPPKTSSAYYDLLSSAGHQGMKNSSVMKLNSKTKKPEAVERSDPLPRINACMVISGTTLFLYGGLLEVGDREITLDDMWSLDLKKRQAWECIWGGTMHKQVWRGAIHDDDDSYYSTDNKTERDDEDDEEEQKEADTADTVPNDGMTSKDHLKAELARLRDTNELTDSNKTPAPGESFTTFYERTSDYWEARTGLSHESGATPKEIKKQSYELAQERFDSLTGVLERFIELEAEYRKEKKKSKKDKR